MELTSTDSDIAILENKLNKEQQYLDVLCQNYILIYAVDLNNNKAKVLKLNPHTNVWKKSDMRPGVTFAYKEHIEEFAEKYVRVSKEEFCRKLQKEYITEQMKTVSRFSFRSESLPNLAGSRHYKVTVIRVNPKEFDGEVLVTSEEIDDLFISEQNQQVEKKKLLEQEQNQKEVLSALGQNYHAIFKIDLQKDLYTEISCRKEIRHYYNKNEASAQQMLLDVCERIVAPKHAERMKRFFHLSTLPERLKYKDYVETECVTQEGNWHKARFIVKRRDDAGTVTHILYVTQIIDNEKQYEEYLITKAESAAYANNAKTDFISQVAHDIRTPMNSIFGFLEIAEANMGDWEKVQYSLEKIRTAGEFLKSLVNDVLDISRMEKGIMKIYPKEIALTQTLNELAISMQASIADKTLDFHFQIHDILYDHVIIDPLRLNQIYANILSNAVKYTPDGGTVNFDVFQEKLFDEQLVRITAVISDTGIGMSEEFVKKMFNKFERATDTRVNTISGYGLGLSIVKQLVDLMHGTLEVQSQPEKGTTVFVKLDVPYTQNPSVKEPQTTEKDAAACVGMHLLVAEDNKLNREVITELLALYNITCDCAEDGSICLQRFSESDENHYDAILMDLQMPILDGIETTQQIRLLPHGKNIPIIAMTANALTSDIQTCLDAGMNCHMSKPVDIKQLLKTLANIC